jgi:hypothetical protein
MKRVDIISQLAPTWSQQDGAGCFGILNAKARSIHDLYSPPINTMQSDTVIARAP